MTIEVNNVEWPACSFGIPECAGAFGKRRRAKEDNIAFLCRPQSVEYLHRR
jgi:hypothetical protein